MQRLRAVGVLSATWDVYVTPLPSWFRDLSRKGCRKITGARGGDDFKDRKSFPDPTGQVHIQTQRDRIACTGPAKAQARQNPGSGQMGI